MPCKAELFLEQPVKLCGIKLCFSCSPADGSHRAVPHAGTAVAAHFGYQHAVSTANDGAVRAVADAGTAPGAQLFINHKRHAQLLLKIIVSYA
jgi:hypothetical protein